MSQHSEADPWALTLFWVKPPSWPNHFSARQNILLHHSTSRQACIYSLAGTSAQVPRERGLWTSKTSSLWTWFNLGFCLGAWRRAVWPRKARPASACWILAKAIFPTSVAPYRPPYSACRLISYISRLLAKPSRSHRSVSALSGFVPSWGGDLGSFRELGRQETDPK